MPSHILVAVDDFTDRHLAAIDAVLAGWATWERIPHASPPDRYAAALRESQVVIGWPHPDWLPESAVAYFQLPSAGHDAYLGRGLEQKPGFTLCNGRGVMGIAVAEHAVALILALARRLPEHIRDMTETRWQRRPSYREVTGATVCVVGLGDIGTEIVRRCLGLGMRVIGVRRDAARGHELVERVFPLHRLTEALTETDHLVLALPSTRETAGMIGAAQLAALPPGACIYNLSRGNLIDEAALIAALASGRVAGAGLDVFDQEPLPAESPLWTMENVIVTPHAAGRSVKEFDRLRDLFVANLGRYRRGEPLANAVDLATE